MNGAGIKTAEINGNPYGLLQVMLLRHVQFSCINNIVGVQRHAQEDVSATCLCKMPDTVQVRGWMIQQ